MSHDPASGCRCRRPAPRKRPGVPRMSATSAPGGGSRIRPAPRDWPGSARFRRAFAGVTGLRGRSPAARRAPVSRSARPRRRRPAVAIVRLWIVEARPRPRRPPAPAPRRQPPGGRRRPLSNRPRYRGSPAAPRNRPASAHERRAGPRRSAGSGRIRPPHGVPAPDQAAPDPVMDNAAAAPRAMRAPGQRCPLSPISGQHPGQAGRRGQAQIDRDGRGHAAGKAQVALRVAGLAGVARAARAAARLLSQDASGVGLMDGHRLPVHAPGLHRP